MSAVSNTKIKLYTPKDLGSILNVSESTVYRLTDSRDISFYKIKGSIRFSEKDIQEYLERQRIDSASL